MPVLFNRFDTVRLCLFWAWNVFELRRWICESAGLEQPRHCRTEGDLNERLGRLKTMTGPDEIDQSVCSPFCSSDTSAPNSTPQACLIDY